MQPKLLRLAAESTDESDNESQDIVDILQTSDDLTRVIERYKSVIVDGKPDTFKSSSAPKLEKQNSELLLDLDLNRRVIRALLETANLSHILPMVPSFVVRSLSKQAFTIACVKEDE